jgi:hypothetical protein
MRVKIAKGLAEGIKYMHGIYIKKTKKFYTKWKLEKNKQRKKWQNGNWGKKSKKKK